MDPAALLPSVAYPTPYSPASRVQWTALHGLQAAADMSPQRSPTGPNRVSLRLGKSAPNIIMVHSTTNPQRLEGSGTEGLRYRV